MTQSGKLNKYIILLILLVLFALMAIGFLIYRAYQADKYFDLVQSSSALVDR